MSVVVGEHGQEVGYDALGFEGGVAYFFAFDFEHEDAVEAFEAGFYFGFVFVGAFGSELYDEGEGLVVGVFVVGEFGALEESGVEVAQPDDYVFVDLYVAFLCYIFSVHHVDELAIPFEHGFSFVVGELAAEDVFVDDVNVELCGTDEVFYLPHVEQVFCHALFFELFCYIHIFCFFSLIYTVACECVDYSCHGYEYYESAYDFVHHPYAAEVEAAAYFVDEVGQHGPPEYGAAHYADEAAGLRYPVVVGHDEFELCEQADEQEDDEGVGEGDEEGGEEVPEVGAVFLGGVGGAERAYGVAPECEYSESQEHEAAHYLQECLVFSEESVHEAHAVACDKRVDDVA